MADQQHTVETFYDRIAPFYDWLATAPIVSGWRARMVDALDLDAGDTVVEMGCGTGANLPHLRERVGPSGTVVGVDLTPGMLSQARARVEREGWGNVHLVRGDATRPPVDGVDAIVSSFVVGLLADPASAVETWVETVVPGGRVAILEAGRSEKLVATPLDLAFRGFVRAASAGDKRSARSPAKQLDRNIVAAQEALAARTVDRQYETAGLGFVQLASGRRPR